MGYIRLERNNVKAKIHRDYMKALRKFEQLRPKPDDRTSNHQEACIYCIEQNKATGTELGKGIYPVLYHEARYKWTKDKNAINLSDHFIDEHIIGVDEITKNVSTGKKQIVTYVVLARGQDAIDRAATFDAHIQGFKDKQKDLNDKGRDKDLTRRLNRKKKMREQIVG